MADENAERDDNRVPVLLAVDDVSGETRKVLVDSSSRMLCSAVIANSAFTDLTDTPSSYSGEGLKVVRVNAGEDALEFATISAGEDNTASNIGTAGVGVFKQKVGVNLEFKKIAPASSKISVVDDAGNNELDLDVVEANLTLDSIGGTLGIAKGGTGATSASAALTALGGIGAATSDVFTNKTFDANATGNSLSNVDLTADIIGTLPIADGGTGETTASAAFGALEQAATISSTGTSELLIASEVTTGTDTTRTMTADALAGSDYGKRVVGILVTDPLGDAIVTGDGQAYFRVPSVMNGWNLVGVAASLTTVSSSGLPTIQLRNITQAADILSTKLSIDASELDSSTATAAAVINPDEDDMATADHIAIDIDIAGAGAKGLYIEMIFQLP